MKRLPRAPNSGRDKERKDVERGMGVWYEKVDDDDVDGDGERRNGGFILLP